MLFVEGNHFCPSCERSGNCLLQATAYQHEMAGPHFEEFYPTRPVDASHPELLLDFNRCILCELCVRASREADGKSVFAIGGHGLHQRAMPGQANQEQELITKALDILRKFSGQKVEQIEFALQMQLHRCEQS